MTVTSNGLAERVVVLFLGSPNGSSGSGSAYVSLTIICALCGFYMGLNSHVTPTWSIRSDRAQM